jgi:hypothetical protein
VRVLVKREFFARDSRFCLRSKRPDIDGRSETFRKSSCATPLLLCACSQPAIISTLKMTISQEKQNPVPAIITPTSTSAQKRKFDETNLPTVVSPSANHYLLWKSRFANSHLRRISHQIEPKPVRNRPIRPDCNRGPRSCATSAYGISNSVPILKRSVSIPLPFAAAVWYASHIT